MAGSPKLRQLADDLRQELEALKRIEAEARRCLGDLAARPPSYLEVRGSADIVHDFYNAVDRFFERVAVEMNGGLPAGPDSHATLLSRMSRELPDVRPRVVSEETRRALEEYLRFRHLFRHRYGFELEWPKLEPLLRGIESIAPRLGAELEGFVSAVLVLAERA